MNSEDRREKRYQRRKAKRQKTIIQRSEQYADWDNVFGFLPLMRGYELTSKSSKSRKRTQIWMSNICLNTYIIKDQLDNGTWKTKGFNRFTIKERGKIRDIRSVDISEKGIQNTFCNNCLFPIIEPHLIYDNGASLKGKGTDFSLDRLTYHLRNHYRKYGRTGGIYFYDFSGYFAHIPIAPLNNGIRELIINQRLADIYTVFVEVFGEMGLGLGSQVSQISAVFYPNSIDHYLKDQLCLKGV